LRSAVSCKQSHIGLNNLLMKLIGLSLLFGKMLYKIVKCALEVSP
jgi:hypothetical protein